MNSVLNVQMEMQRIQSLDGSTLCNVEDRNHAVEETHRHGITFLNKKSLYFNPVCRWAMIVRNSRSMNSSTIIQNMMLCGGYPILRKMKPTGNERKCIVPTTDCRTFIFPVLSIATCNPMVSWLINTMTKKARQNMTHSSGME